MLSIFYGPGKTGSTWLYNTVSNSRVIEVPLIKETNVLLREDFTIENYDVFFKTECHKIDFGNTYIYSNTAFKNLGQLNPGMFRVIIGYRQTKERVVSMYLHDIRTGQLPPNCSIDEAVLMDQKFREKIDLSVNLKRLLNSNFEILFWNYGWLKEGNHRKIERFFDLLGDGGIQYDLETKSNIARLPKFRIISIISTPVAKSLRKLGCWTVLNQLKHNKFLQNILFNNASKEHISMSRKTVNYLEEVDSRIREVLRTYGFD